MNEQLKQLIITKMQERLRKYVSIKDDIEKVFTDWFQGLVSAASMAEMPPTPPVEEGK